MTRIMRNTIAYSIIGFIAINACGGAKKTSTDLSVEPVQEETTAAVPEVLDTDRTACEQPWGNPEVETENKKRFAYFQTNYKDKDYAEAIKNWRHLVKNAPCAHRNIYLIGERVIKKLIPQEKDSTKRAELIANLNTNFSNRIQYFGDEANQTARWGKTLYKVAPEQYDMISKKLEKTINRDGDSTEASVMIYYLNNAFNAFNAKKLTNDEMFETYNKLTDIVEHNIEVNQGDSIVLGRWMGLQHNLDQIIAKVGTCEDLIAQYKPNLAANAKNKEYLSKAEKALRAKKCTKDKLYIDVLEKLYAIDPSLEVAKRLANYYYGAGANTTKGNQLMEKVIQLDNNPRKNSDRYVTMANKALKAGNASAARNYANKALKLNSSNGYALLIKGSALYKIARANCSGFDKKAAAWIAMEYALRAKSADGRVSSQASRSYSRYAAAGPNKEEMFFNNVKAGQRYTLKCAGITTTAR